MKNLIRSILLLGVFATIPTMNLEARKALTGCDRIDLMGKHGGYCNYSLVCGGNTQLIGSIAVGGGSCNTEAFEQAADMCDALCEEYGS